MSEVRENAKKVMKDLQHKTEDDRVRKYIKTFIPPLVQECIREKGYDGIQKFRMHKAAVEICSRVLDYYEHKRDGGLFRMVSWFVESSVTMMLDEIGYNKLDIILDPEMFFFNITNRVALTQSSARVASYYGIYADAVCIRKACEVYLEGEPMDCVK